MLTKNDIFPMFVNVSLIIGGVVLICLAGTDESLTQHVQASVTWTTSICTFIVNSIIALATFNASLKLWNGRRYLCVGVIALGIGLLTATQVFLLPFLEQTFGATGDYFVEYVKLISNPAN
jgi:hypothetical protein